MYTSDYDKNRLVENHLILMIKKIRMFYGTKIIKIEWLFTKKNKEVVLLYFFCYFCYSCMTDLVLLRD